MSNPNSLLSQILCYYLNEGRTVSDISMRAAHSVAFFYLSKLSISSKMSISRFSK